MVELHTQPEVSIIIPTHNEGAWLHRTIEGILDATRYPSYEILVVDDGSSDGSCAFIDEVFERGARLRLVRGQHLGVSGARALGAEHAQGENLVFLDSHVLPDPGWLREMMNLLSDSSVGIAGLGVRDVQKPGAHGYAYVPANENLHAAWAAPRGKPPYEVPAVIGCCFGIRKPVYQAIGGFDPGSVGWGVDDIELSLRAWFTGYRCIASPAVQVAHWFKDLDERSYAVRWEDYDVNMLRCAFIYFEGPRLSAILNNAAERESFRNSLARIHADDEYWSRRSWIRERFERDEAWYFERFTAELRPLDQRLKRVLRRHRRNWLMNIQRNTNCPSCGAQNMGIQENCLICGAELPASDAGRVAQSQGEGSKANSACSNCGSTFKAGVRFCTVCGTPVPG